MRHLQILELIKYNWHYYSDCLKQILMTYFSFCIQYTGRPRKHDTYRFLFSFYTHLNINLKESIKHNKHRTIFSLSCWEVEGLHILSRMPVISLQVVFLF